MKRDSESKIFRKAALDHKISPVRAGIMLARPVSFTVLSGCVAVFLIASVIFVFNASYSSRTAVKGVISADSGITRIEAPIAGTVSDVFVADNQLVNVGDKLYEITSEGRGQLSSLTQASVSESIRNRLETFKNETAKLKLLHTAQRSAAEINLMQYGQQVMSIEAQLKLQEERVRYSEESSTRYKELRSKNFISSEQLQTKLMDHIDNLSRLQSLRTELATAKRILSSANTDKATLPLTQSVEIDRLTRENSLVQQDYDESEAKRKIVVRAPMSGTVTSANYMTGQAVPAGGVLAFVVPRHFRPVVHLYVPSRAVGFVRPGSSVDIRFEAFPYQRFGSVKGKTRMLSKTVLTPADLSQLNLPTNISGGENAYRAVIDLTQDASGISREAMKVGMAVDADIIQEKRKLYEWMFVPINGVKSRLQ